MMIDRLATTVFEGTGLHVAMTDEAQPLIESKRHSKCMFEEGRALRGMAGRRFEKNADGRSENYATLRAGLRREARQRLLSFRFEESVDGQLVASVGRRRRTDERIVAAPAHGSGARVTGVLEIGRRFPCNVAGAQHGGHHDQRKRNFFKNLKTGRHGNLFG
ncbi:hypothetical protein [Paraburkholderia azotifigens]|uniref:Uncharacterized protein n=1 Tax=Paraburkholderia azotifigens TaxID=2057004 RepID=A0ABU9RCN4_9BURK